MIYNLYRDYYFLFFFINSIKAEHLHGVILHKHIFPLGSFVEVVALLLIPKVYAVWFPPATKGTWNPPLTIGVILLLTLGWDTLKCVIPKSPDTPFIYIYPIDKKI